MEPSKHILGDGKPVLFIDMDGVLCDFVSAAILAIWSEGLTTYTVKKTLDRWQGMHPGVWDICEVCEITSNQLWDAIHIRGQVFWKNLQPTPIYDDFRLWMINQKSEIDMVIASSPSHHPTSYAGKAQWLLDHRINLSHCMLGSAKHLLAGLGKVLVDDNEQNCERFRKFGGQAVLVPQVWNSLHAIAAQGAEAQWQYVEQELCLKIDIAISEIERRVA